MWSFGVVLMELITYGAKPYQGMTNKEVVSKLEEGYRMPRPEGCPDQLHKIMMDCWKKVGWDLFEVEDSRENPPPVKCG